MTLDDEDIEAIADRVAAKLTPPRVGLVTPEQLASELHVKREWVYEHAQELGVIRLGAPGPGKKPRLRFDLERAREAAEQLASEVSPKPAPRPRRGRPRKVSEPRVTLREPRRRGV